MGCHCNIVHCLEMGPLVVLFLVFEFVTCQENIKRDSIIDHIHSGIKIAKDFLGSESVAMKVADFVVRAFQTTSPNRKQPTYDEHHSNTFSSEESISKEKYQNNGVNESPLSPWRHVVKLFGLQTNQISAVAVNALIFIAQMITTFLSGPQRPSRQRSDDLSKWILEKRSKTLQDLIAGAKNESLSDSLEQLIQEPEEETSCIRLLVCKITPFVVKMQGAVFGEQVTEDFNERGSKSLYRHLPTKEEIQFKGDICEKRYKQCDLKE